MVKILPAKTWIASHKQHRLPSDLTAADIQNRLPGIVDQGLSGDEKCTHTWDFLIDGVECSIWDYRGARWSAYGPAEVLQCVFPELNTGW